ncbi:MAG: class I adenylate-forming enzyme family protein [Syntrophobacteraceae bacterium]
MKWPSVGEYLKKKALQFGDRRLITDYGTDVAYSYKEFDTLTDRLASGFRKLGIESGDRIAFLYPNHTDLLLGYFAAIKAGATAVPINSAYTPREIMYILKDSASKILMSTEQFENNLRIVEKEASMAPTIIMQMDNQRLEERISSLVDPAANEETVESSADDLAMIFYTSGTTGKPKGVMISHRNITFTASNMAQSYGLSATDVTIACLPLNHIFGNASPFWGSLASGGSVVVMERFKTEWVFDAIRKYHATWFPGVPTMFNYLLSDFDKQPRDVSSLEMGLSGGASLSLEHLKEFEGKFGSSILEVYGLTESTGLVTANPVYGVRKAGSIGICASGVAVRLVDADWRDVPIGEVGELVFKGPNGTMGFWELPEETEKRIRDGWISTGDLAYQDSEGYFYIAGRKNELIISGGYNIFPREIEEVLYRHPNIREAAVIGVSDLSLGEVPKAFVALKAGEKTQVDDLRKFCQENLATYKVPKVFVLMNELPKNMSGKILKKELI